MKNITHQVLLDVVNITVGWLVVHIPDTPKGFTGDQGPAGPTP